MGAAHHHRLIVPRHSTASHLTLVGQVRGCQPAMVASYLRVRPHWRAAGARCRGGGKPEAAPHDSFTPRLRTRHPACAPGVPSLRPSSLVWCDAGVTAGASDPDGQQPPVVSVVMPFQDAAPFLRDAVGSVLQQSWAALELVLVDDGGTDGSERIAHGLAAADPRVRVVTHEGRQNRGTGPSRALG